MHGAVVCGVRFCGFHLRSVRRVSVADCETAAVGKTMDNCSATPTNNVMLAAIIDLTLEDGLQYSYLKLPSAIWWALGQVPRLVYDLNSAAFSFTLCMALLVTPIALITAVQCIWAIAGIGAARKLLSTTFLLLLWPFVVAFMTVALAGLWAMLGLGVIAFIWLLPLGIVVATLWYGLSSATEWRTEQHRIASRVDTEVVDITFLELGLALLVACISACTTAPLVAAVALLKSPIVFICVTLRCLYHVCQGLAELVKNACWTMVFVPPAFGLALIGVVISVALGTAFSILVKVVGATLWPGYVACGMLRSLGSRRQTRGCVTILLQACQAAYQVLWFSDILTNTAVLMRFSLASTAMEQLAGIAAGTRRELSADVRAVSCLPPIVIGVLHNDGAWRVDIERLASALHMDEHLLETAWTSFFQQMNTVGEQMVDRQLLTSDYLSECPPALLIGLPAIVLLTAIGRSPKSQPELLLANGGVRVNNATRPRGVKFADEAWKLLLEAKKAYEATQPLEPLSYAALEAYLLAGGAPSDELPPLLAAAVADGEEGLPPPLAAVHKPLYALVYKMAQQPVFKQHFTSAVYNSLVEYVPVARVVPRGGNGYVPPPEAML